MDYTKGKIYKIIGNGLTYYGSTIQDCKQRFYYHKSIPSSTILPIMSDINAEIILIEEYSCNNKEELLWRERYWIENNECVNKNLPIITNADKKKQQKIYDDKRKEQRKVKDKKKYEKNKESIKKAKKKYYEENKGKNKEVNKEVKKKASKKYYEANKENIIKKKKIYDDSRKEQKKEADRLRYLRKKELFAE
jgi:hypothetical protein